MITIFMSEARVSGFKELSNNSTVYIRRIDTAIPEILIMIVVPYIYSLHSEQCRYGSQEI